MAVRSSPPSFVARAAATAVIAAALTATAPASAATVGATGLLDLGCAQQLLPEPTRLATALADGVSALLVRQQNDLTADELAHLAADDTSWLDECGSVFVADHATPRDQQVTAEALPAETVPADVFALSSRAGSTRTIYLDFDGATYSGTRWKDGAEIVSPAYSIDADRTTFNATERAQVYLAWRTVAEVFAPFDVNVTTQRPDPSALSRTASTDQTYGIPVVVTPTNSVGSGCGCGGISYLSIFGAVNATDYQPAWIFTSGSGTGGYDVGQIISHEVGHTFGLSHDGTGTNQGSYYAGAKGWAPIMGSSYGKRASHWSSGEYAGANNPEDDTAVIARTAPVLVDDHANAALGATRLTAGTTATGAITTRTDTDAFTFSASGRTALTVAGPAGLSNLDVRLTILSPVGATVATIDPVADIADDAAMSATWSVDLPTTAATYVAVVDGTGFGAPTEAGRYSDYGSLGAYAVTLATGGSTATPPPAVTPTATTPTAPSIAFVTTRLPAAHAGARYRATIRFSGPVSEARVDWRLPRGLRWAVVGDRVVIRGRVRKSSGGRFATVLSGDGGSVRRVFRLVVR